MFYGSCIPFRFKCIIRVHSTQHEGDSARHALDIHSIGSFILIIVHLHTCYQTARWCYHQYLRRCGWRLLEISPSTKEQSAILIWEQSSSESKINYLKIHYLKLMLKNVQKTVQSPDPVDVNLKNVFISFHFISFSFKCRFTAGGRSSVMGNTLSYSVLKKSSRILLDLTKTHCILL